MHEKPITPILRILLVQSPVLLVCLAGLILSLRFRRKAPAASFWVAAALAIALVTCGQTIFVLLTPSYTLAVLVALPISVTYVLLLIAVYVGRISSRWILL